MGLGNVFGGGVPPVARLAGNTRLRVDGLLPILEIVLKVGDAGNGFMAGDATTGGRLFGPGRLQHEDK